jgi:hypothetical protein
VAQVAWPDVDFTASIDDRFGVTTGSEGASIIKVDSTFAQDADTTWINILAGIATLGGAILINTVSGWFLPLLFFGMGLAIEEDYVHNASGSLPTTPGMLLAAKFPVHQPIPGGLKFVFDYRQPAVGLTGISAGAVIQIRSRAPSVSLSGPRELRAHLPVGTRNGSGSLKAGGSYRLTGLDVRPPLQAAWTTSGRVMPPSTAPCADASLYGIGFDLGSPDTAVDTTERIGVRITDADGLTASAEIDVAVRVPVDTGPPLHAPAA